MTRGLRLRLVSTQSRKSKSLISVASVLFVARVVRVEVPESSWVSGWFSP